MLRRSCWKQPSYMGRLEMKTWFRTFTPAFWKSMISFINLRQSSQKAAPWPSLIKRALSFGNAEEVPNLHTSWVVTVPVIRKFYVKKKVIDFCHVMRAVQKKTVAKRRRGRHRIWGEYNVKKDLR
jgi:hypothetical protein